MGKRGPIPAHQRVRALPGRETRRAPPPEDLTEAQSRLWRDIVETEPQDLFDSAARRHLLRCYCEHASFRADLQSLLNRVPVEKMLDRDLQAGVEQMLKTRDRETKALVSLATRLRLTNQSRYTPGAAGTAGRNAPPSGPAPWEDPNTGTDYFND